MESQSVIELRLRCHQLRLWEVAAGAHVAGPLVTAASLRVRSFTAAVWRDRMYLGLGANP